MNEFKTCTNHFTQKFGFSPESRFHQFSPDAGEWPQNQILILDWSFFHCAPLRKLMNQFFISLCGQESGRVFSTCHHGDEHTDAHHSGIHIADSPVHSLCSYFPDRVHPRLNKSFSGPCAAGSCHTELLLGQHYGNRVGWVNDCSCNLRSHRRAYS